MKSNVNLIGIAGDQLSEEAASWWGKLNPETRGMFIQALYKEAERDMERMVKSAKLALDAMVTDKENVL